MTLNDLERWDVREGLFLADPLINARTVWPPNDQNWHLKTDGEKHVSGGLPRPIMKKGAKPQPPPSFLDPYVRQNGLTVDL